MTDVQGEWPAADAVLDTSGLNCPLPLLKAKLELNRLPSGAVLKVSATDAGSQRDFRAFARLAATLRRFGRDEAQSRAPAVPPPSTMITTSASLPCVVWTVPTRR